MLRVKFIKSSQLFGSLSSKKIIFKNFSSKPGSIFKRICNFQQGDQSPELFLSEHQFRTHNSSFREALKDLTISQTPAEQKEFITEVASTIIRNTQLQPEKILKGVLSSVQENLDAQQAILSLSSKAIKAAQSCPMKPRVEEDLRNSFSDISHSDLARLNEQGLGFKDVNIVDLPAYKSLVTKFTSQLDLASGPNPMESIDILIDLSNTSELVTFLSANQMLVKGLGLPMFMIGYYSLGSENSFKIFLGEVRDLVEWKLTPVYKSIKVSFSFVYKHKFKIITTTSFAGFMYHFFFTNVKLPLVESAVLPPIPKLELKLESKWAPNDPLTKDRFVAFRDDVGQMSYMVSNTVSSFFVGASHGVLDAAETPEVRHQIAEGLNKVVPAVVDTIVEYSSQGLKKKEK